MLLDYLTAAMERAHYEIIEDEEPYYGEIPGLHRDLRSSINPLRGRGPV
jgi:hypothetical protein